MFYYDSKFKQDQLGLINRNKNAQTKMEKRQINKQTNKQRIKKVTLEQKQKETYIKIKKRKLKDLVSTNPPPFTIPRITSATFFDFGSFDLQYIIYYLLYFIISCDFFSHYYVRYFFLLI